MYFCDRNGHLAKFCYDHINSMNNHAWVRNTNALGPKKIWVPKSSPKLFDIVHTKTPRRKERWYLDSDCSRHMTWDINNFATLSRYVEGSTVTFGDDSKSKIVGIGNIKIGSSPLIENVVLINGLKKFIKH